MHELQLVRKDRLCALCCFFMVLSVCLLAPTSFTVAATNAKPTALIADDRREHFFDRPFPSDELISNKGTLDLSGYPRAGIIGTLYVTGWVRQSKLIRAFSPLTPIYFRFDSDIAVDGNYSSHESDPVQLYSLDSNHRVRINVKFQRDNFDDPYFPDNLLMIHPDESDHLHSGERYIALVKDSVATQSDSDFMNNPHFPDDTAVATVFTVQDGYGELQGLKREVDRILEENPQLTQPRVRQVASLRYENGRDDNNNEVTWQIIQFVDGTTERLPLSFSEESRDRTINFSNDPYDLFQMDIQSLVFQPKKSRPYMLYGPLNLLLDWLRRDGAIEFGSTGNVESNYFSETMRVLVQIPKQGRELPVLMWGHGAGGEAYAAISRKSISDRTQEIRKELAGQAIIVSHDTALFGQRFPFFQHAGAADQAMVNIPNLIAWRDNSRQMAVDHRVLYQFIRNYLASEFPDAVDETRIAAFGHSTGAQMIGLASVLHGKDGPSAYLHSGGGGFLANYAVQSRNVFKADETLRKILFFLSGEKEPQEPSSKAFIGAIAGIPASAWDRIDHWHPLLNIFQLISSGADPLAMAKYNPKQTRYFMGVGDEQTPNISTLWSANVKEQFDIVPCEVASNDYDPHYCARRELNFFNNYSQFVRQIPQAAE